MKISSAVIVAIIAFAAVASANENWTQFRGPNSQGNADAKNLPINLGQDQTKWDLSIHGKAWSSPVVWGKQVWVTTATENGNQLYAICVDRDTGTIVHDLKLFDVTKPQYCHPYNSYASPTPVIEEGRVYVTFGSPGTACLDTNTGKIIWQRADFVCNHYRGAASSPVLFRDLLLMHFDGSDHQYVVALDKNTGKTVWKTNRSVDFKDLGADGKPIIEGDFRKAFSTPVITKLDGRDLMLSLGSKALYAYDPTTGQEIWRIEHPGCHSGSPTPVIGDGIAYVCMGLSKGELWAIRLDPNAKGVITSTHVAWKITRDIPTRCSPVLVGESLYVVSDEGMLSCLEAKTGNELWRKRLKGIFSASPLYADGRIHFLSEGGHITVIEPAAQYKPLWEGRIDDGFMASPAVAADAIYLRTKRNLYRMHEN